MLTTSSGLPVDDLTNSMTAGHRGPVVLQDLALIDTMAHFDRERIPERVVHAKGAGAFGYFEVTHDITDICKVTRVDFTMKQLQSEIILVHTGQSVFRSGQKNTSGRSFQHCGRRVGVS